MRLFSVQEVAEVLNVHEKTVRRYINNGYLEAKKIGGQWRIEEENLEKILNVGTCCNSHNITDDISGDDFCVFMDSDFFDSTDIVQICSIVDYYTDDVEYANSILERLKSVAYDFIIKGQNVKVDFNYSTNESKARYVIWATPQNIELFTNIIKRMEKK